MVGGAVRDQFLGVKNKDIDFSVEASSYEAMRDFIKRHGKIYLEKPEYLTIRARLNNLEGFTGDADFVLCRREGAYTDGRRPDVVYHGTIYDDLARRDFTVNAIAMQIYPCTEGLTYIDPFHGIADIGARYLRCVGDPRERFAEDALRMIRALRFSVMKGMQIDPTIQRLLDDDRYVELLRTNISMDRKKDELLKMFKYSTIQTLDILSEFPKIQYAVFGTGELWLEPTNRK